MGDDLSDLLDQLFLAFAGQRRWGCDDLDAYGTSRGGGGGEPSSGPFGGCMRRCCSGGRDQGFSRLRRGERPLLARGQAEHQFLLERGLLVRRHRSWAWTKRSAGGKMIANIGCWLLGHQRA